MGDRFPRTRAVGTPWTAGIIRGRELYMESFGQGLAIAGLSLLALVAAGPADAQKSGGVLKIEHFDSPASMSILEESTRAALQPMMAVFNNLVIYDQKVKQNSLNSIIPDLATSW